jgi:hypothetical protein
MQAYEKLGVFYLGRYHDLGARQTLPDLLLYNSNDLLTHALCVGMTGSGKTGLCFDIIEEAAIDGIPAILIDPKGDLANLMLTFPELRGSDFEPWVNADDARKKGLSPADFAAQQAELWKKGLASWDQDGDRIRRLREAADFTIYTPGSNAGVPISILNSFAAPPQAILDDNELLRERVNSTVSGLLGLVGVEADPTRSREAIFMANIIQRAWQDGRDLDLGGLIQEIQTPNVQRIGVMDVESFYPAKDRFALATAINGLLASPGFGAWLEGEPLDIQRIYYTPEGKPRIAIFSIAHLNDAERMFFVTLLLNQLLAWMRTQSGTTSLRALLYMDEIFGYFPPVANPPSKLPLLTLLKQGRAFGLGAVLATQNPVDLDYKGLANIGTWFLGRLQTDRDKQRVLDGLEGAASTQGSSFDRAVMEQTLAGLGNRVFLLHNVHEDGASIFESRWAMSYLRGPMTRNQIKTVMDTRRAPAAAPARPSGAPASARISTAPAGARIGATPRPSAPLASAPEPEPETPAAPAVETPRSGGLESSRPTLPPAIPQHFIPVRGATGQIVYQPMLLGAASVRFADAKTKVDVTQNVVLLTPIDDDAVPVDWAQAQDLELDPNELERNPASAAQFAPLPPAAAQAKNYANWQKDFVNAVYGTRKVTLLKSTTFSQVSKIDEGEGDFRVRLSQASREQRDAATAKLRAKYAPKMATLNERLRRAEQAVEREASQAKQAKLSSVLSIGSTLLGAFLGKKAISAGNISKAGTAVRSVGRASEQAGDVARAGETVGAIQQQLADLDAQFQAEAKAIEGGLDPASETFETIELRPNKTNISVKLVALAWTPHVRDAAGQLTPAI